MALLLLNACSRQMVPPLVVPSTTTPVEKMAATDRVGATMRLDYLVVEQGATVELKVVVDRVVDLFGAEAHLTFDVTRLEVVDAKPLRPGIQIGDGDLLNPDFVVRNLADNESGLIYYAVSHMPPRRGVDGSGVLLRIIFRARASGTAEVALRQVVLATSSGEEIPSTITQETVSLTVH